jgi:hypothetical protein
LHIDAFKWALIRASLARIHAQPRTSVLRG